MKKRIVIGISGASGALYAQRTVSHLLELGHEVHVVASPSGVRLLVDELGADGFDLHLLGGLKKDEDPRERGLIKHNIRDVGAVIASGSFRHDGMAIVPCSSHTLNAVSCGLGDNLLVRAAAVTLKERRKLVVLHRESPLTLMDIRAMETITLAGGIICPASPGFYLLPQSVGEMVDFMVARVLDLLGVEHGLGQRWEGETPKR